MPGRDQNIGLPPVMYKDMVFGGVVSSVDSTTAFRVDALQGDGFGDSYFKNWEVYPLWDSAGAGDAPQNEHSTCSAFTSTGGIFTHTAFTTPLVVGDKVLVVHPWFAALVNTTSGLAALATAIGLIPASSGTSTWNATALAAVTTQAALALSNILLNKLMSLADGTGAYPASVVEDSALAKVLSKADPAVTTSFNNTTDSLEALADAISAAKTVVDTISTNMGDMSGDVLKSVKTKIGDIAKSLDVILGARWDSSGDLGTDIAQLLTYTDLIDDATNGLAAIKAEVEGLAGAAMRGTDNAALASVLGALDTAGATGAVSDAKLAMAYLKQLVTQLLETDGVADNIKTKTDLIGASVALSGEATSALAAVAYTRQAGVQQIAPTTFELNQTAIARTIYTGTTQDVLLESLVVRNLTDMTGGNTTSFSVQTDDTTPQVLIPNTMAVKAALTVGAQFYWTGAVIVKAGVHIQLTINGAACGGTDIMTIEAKCRACTTGGYLA